MLRQVTYILTYFFPLYQDPLSYGGRQLVFSPLFPYILALFGSIFPIWWVAKVVPNVLAVVTSLFVFLILRRLTRHEGVALFSAFVTGLFPLFLTATVSTLSPHTLALPFLLACIYCYFLVCDNVAHLPVLLVLIAVFPFVHLSALFLIGGLFFYWIISIVQGLAPRKIEREVILFDTIYTLWLLFLLYKKAFLVHGLALIWQNIPSAVLNAYFEPISVISSFASIGILPIIFGTYIVYKYTFTKGEWEWYVIIGFVLFFFMLLSFKLLEPIVGSLYLGIFLFILSGKYFCLALDYIEKTKLADYKRVSVMLFCMLFVISLFAFPKENNHPSQELVDALGWLGEYSQPQETVLGTVEEGDIITAVAVRKNVWDSQFLLIPAIEQRANDITQLFQTASEITAVTLLSKYGVNYILFSPNAQKQYSLSELVYTTDENCFTKIYEKNDVRIYKVLCTVKAL